MSQRRVQKYSSLGTLALFLGPAFAIIIVLRIYPIFQGMYLSFTAWDGLTDPVWIGIGNFQRMLSDPVLLTALGNSAKILLFTPLWIFGPLILASVIQERIPGAPFFKIAYILPVLISPAVIGVLFVVILGPNGPLNIVLRSIGLGTLAINWTVSTTWVMWILAGLLVWSTFGLGVILFSAALSSVDRTYYEAAELDGANWTQRFWYVTVPSVRSVTEYWGVVVVILAFSSAISIGYAFSGGGPGYASTTIDLFIYNQAFRYGSPSYGTAIGIVVFLFIALLLLVFLRLTRIKGNQNIETGTAL